MIKANLRKLTFATLGFLVLLLTLSPVSSVFAVGLGHGFYGTVKVDGVDADIGTVISAQVAGIEYGNWTVTTTGQYALIVQGDIDEGATIHFYVDGQEADQPFPYHDGWTTTLNLTATTSPAIYALTMAANPVGGGTATDLTNASPYTAGTGVNIKAVAAAGYRFVNWMATAGVFDNANAAETTFTMPAQAATVTANFAETVSWCFIATAAYGTPTAKQIDVLRQFRDGVLLKSTAGSQFVALYYRFSPPIADFIASNELLRTLVREFFVDPIVRVVEATGAIWQN
jgi:Divergent InlB B-repeat domain